MDKTEKDTKSAGESILWDSLAKQKTIESILHDKGLAKVGDNIVNLCYSLAKSIVLSTATGEKVRDSVLARAIRATPVYSKMRRRTDIGGAGDAYEAIIAWLWLNQKVTITELVQNIVNNLQIDSTMNRRQEGEIAAQAFQILLEHLLDMLPEESSKGE
ncbi:MAG: ribonuclease III family protein [Candidatus Thorarchaeota archaeon]